MPDPRVVALVSAFNEADIIEPVIRHLIEQGLFVYLIDDGSDDDTVQRVEPYVGRGVIAIETRPRQPPADGGASRAFDWGAILRKKEVLAQTLRADWFIHHDADEFRESPWPEVTLAGAIARVDRLGYTAIDFQLFDFWPTTDPVADPADVRERLPGYEPAEAWNRVQVKCWKNLGVPVDLESSGGHEAKFEGRRVCPIRFVLRHYPVRSAAQGARKLSTDRLPRFLASERERGWHVQYDEFAAGKSLLRDPASLTQYDPVRVRFDLALRHRGVEDLERQLSAASDQTSVLSSALEAARREIDHEEHQAAHARRVVADLTSALGEAQEVVTLRESEARAARETISALTHALDQAREVVDVREQEADRARHVIADLQRTLADARGALEAREAEACQARNVIADQARALADAQAAIADRDRALALERKTRSDREQRLEAALAEIRASGSWRLTSPLRLLGRWFHRGR